MFPGLLIHGLTGATDILQTLDVGIHESFLHVHVSALLVLVLSVVDVTSVSVHVSGLATRTPTPALAPISSRHWDADVDRLMVCWQKWTLVIRQ